MKHRSGFFVKQGALASNIGARGSSRLRANPTGVRPADHVAEIAGD